MKGPKGLDAIIIAVKHIKKIKDPKIVRSYIAQCSSKTIQGIIGILANLIHNPTFFTHPLFKHKNKVKKIMVVHRKKWLNVTEDKTKSLSYKRKFMIEQICTGSLQIIISAVLPLLISLLKKHKYPSI